MILQQAGLMRSKTKLFFFKFLPSKVEIVLRFP